MKKGIIFFLILSLLIVSGCSGVPVPESSANPETTPEPRGEITISVVSRIFRKLVCRLWSEQS